MHVDSRSILPGELQFSVRTDCGVMPDSVQFLFFDHIGNSVDVVYKLRQFTNSLGCRVEATAVDFPDGTFVVGARSTSSGLTLGSSGFMTSSPKIQILDLTEDLVVDFRDDGDVFELYLTHVPDTELKCDFSLTDLVGTEHKFFDFPHSEPYWDAPVCVLYVQTTNLKTGLYSITVHQGGQEIGSVDIWLTQ